MAMNEGGDPYDWREQVLPFAMGASNETASITTAPATATPTDRARPTARRRGAMQPQR